MNEKIPSQKTGSKSDTASKVVLENEQLAAEHYQTVKNRFFDVNLWHLFAGEEKAEFALRDSQGNLSQEKPKVGDYITIKIPALHNPDGDGYDWVMVEHIEEKNEDHYESAYMRVRPASDPKTPTDKTVHFFDNQATSNFIIERDGNTVSAEVHARNEVPNTEDLNLLEKIRNSVVALGGMLIGSKIQWKAFADGLIKYEE